MKLAAIAWWFYFLGMITEYTITIGFTHKSRFMESIIYICPMLKATCNRGDH